MKKQTSNNTMQSIQSQVTESMKQSFVECRKNYTKDEILSHIADFSSRKVKKAWLSKRINDRVVFLRLMKQASTEGWKHFYGQPIHQKFVELSMATLLAMLEIRLSLSPQTERESLKETFMQSLLGSEAPKQKSQPKVEPQPKAVTKTSKPKVSKAKPQPKVEQADPQNEVLLELTKSVTALATQLTSLTEMVQNNSKAIAELQSQPKVEDKPKVSRAKKQPKVEAEVEQPKVETKPKAKRQPKVAKQDSQISMWEAFSKGFPAKKEQKCTISHDDAFNNTWKKALMEVF